MSAHEHEWELLSEAWRAIPAPVDTTRLKKIVASHRRRLLIVAAIEIAIVLAFAVLSAFIAADGVESWEAIWLLTLWAFTIIAVAFVIWNRRGTWHALGESVGDYVRITRLRAERQMRSIYFVCGLFVAELIAIVVQLAWFDRFTFFAAALLAASGAAIAAWCWAMKKKVARDLRTLEEYGEMLG